MSASRCLREVPESIWLISPELGERKLRLLAPPDPASLLNMVEVEAKVASNRENIALEWKSSDEFPGYCRLVAKIPISRPIFDQLFNGRSGYRAQYYLSPEEGVLYNRDIVLSLKPAIKQAFDHAPLTTSWPLVERSLAGK